MLKTLAMPNNSASYSYNELKTLLVATQAILKVTPDGNDKKKVLAGLEQLSNLIEGLKVQSNTIRPMGGLIPYDDKTDDKSFVAGVERLKNNKGLWALYQNGNIRAFEITKNDIDSLIPINKNYHSIRAYPMLHPIDKTAFTYAFVVVKNQDLVKANDGKIYGLTEDTKTMRDIWGPWPPRKNVLQQTDLDTTLLKHYK